MGSQGATLKGKVELLSRMTQEGLGAGRWSRPRLRSGPSFDRTALAAKLAEPGAEQHSKTPRPKGRKVFLFFPQWSFSRLLWWVLFAVWCASVGEGPLQTFTETRAGPHKEPASVHARLWAGVEDKVAGSAKSPAYSHQIATSLAEQQPGESVCHMNWLLWGSKRKVSNR